MPFLSLNQQCQYSEGLVKDEDGNMVNEQAVRVATQYTPDPLLPPWASTPRTPPSRRNVAVVSHAQYVLTVTTAPASRVKAAVSKAAW